MARVKSKLFDYTCEGMPDLIVMVSGIGPVETWNLMSMWHSSERALAEEAVAHMDKLGRDLE